MMERSFRKFIFVLIAFAAVAAFADEAGPPTVKEQGYLDFLTRYFKSIQEYKKASNYEECDSQGYICVRSQIFVCPDGGFAPPGDKAKKEEREGYRHLMGQANCHGQQEEYRHYNIAPNWFEHDAGLCGEAQGLFKGVSKYPLKKGLNELPCKSTASVHGSSWAELARNYDAANALIQKATKPSGGDAGVLYSYYSGLGAGRDFNLPSDNPPPQPPQPPAPPPPPTIDPLLAECLNLDSYGHEITDPSKYRFRYYIRPKTTADCRELQKCFDKVATEKLKTSCNSTCDVASCFAGFKNATGNQNILDSFKGVDTRKEILDNKMGDRAENVLKAENSLQAAMQSYYDSVVDSCFMTRLATSNPSATCAGNKMSDITQELNMIQKWRNNMLASPPQPIGKTITGVQLGDLQTAFVAFEKMKKKSFTDEQIKGYVFGPTFNPTPDQMAAGKAFFDAVHKMVETPERYEDMKDIASADFNKAIQAGLPSKDDVRDGIQRSANCMLPSDPQKIDPQQFLKDYATAKTLLVYQQLCDDLSGGSTGGGTTGGDAGGGGGGLTDCKKPSGKPCKPKASP